MYKGRGSKVHLRYALFKFACFFFWISTKGSRSEILGVIMHACTHEQWTRAFIRHLHILVQDMTFLLWNLVSAVYPCRQFARGSSRLLVSQLSNYPRYLTGTPQVSS